MSGHFMLLIYKSRKTWESFVCKCNGRYSTDLSELCYFVTVKSEKVDFIFFPRFFFHMHKGAWNEDANERPLRPN